MIGNVAKSSSCDMAPILLVDDEPRNLDALECLLDASGYSLIRATSADTALKALLEQDFAAILMDVRMPDVSGIELAALIRQRKRSQGIPIIFLTAQAPDHDEIIKGYEAGAADYLTKPIDSRILKTKIAVFVDLYNKKQELIRVQEALHRANAELESRVQERTEKLAEANRDLQLSHDLTREREERYRQLVKHLPVAVYTTDAAGRLNLYNEAAVRLWGRAPDLETASWYGAERIYRPDGSKLPPEEHPVTATLRDGTPVAGQEIVIERPDGSRRHVLSFPNPIRDALGNIAGAVNLFQDITETRQAEAGLRQLAAIVESSDDAIISKNLDSIITSWNRGAERLFGYQAEEVIGKPVMILMPPERWDEEPRILDRIRSGERIDHYETTRQCKDGRLIEISLTVSPIRDSKGTVVGASKIVRDITPQKQAVRDLARANAAILAASRAKDDFLAALSHELRTPLNPVLLIASDAAQDSTLPPEIRERFATIRANVELEARLIDDLLDITSISHGKLSLSLQSLDLKDAMAAAIETVRPEFDRKKVGLHLDLTGGGVVKGDPVRLRQIFWNILKNAVKFTPSGGTVSVKTRLSSGDNRVVIEITDTGIGLTAQEIDSIFNAFSQGEHASQNGSHHFGGLGLGLTISRMLVNLHCGTICATSAGRNHGSTFTIELPLLAVPVEGADPAPASPPDPKPAPAGPGIRILLVEDHEPTRVALTQLLSRRRHSVLPAVSLTEARRIASREKLDLVISDIGLPDGDGYALMAELRKNFGLKGIALTGYGMEQDILRSKDAGFIGHLTKPVRIENLDEILGLYTEAPAREN